MQRLVFDAVAPPPIRRAQRQRRVVTSAELRAEVEQAVAAVDLQPAQSAAASETVTPDPLRAAIAGLEDRWLEDGWIWAPPAPGGGRV